MLLNILNLGLFGNVFGTLKIRYVNAFVTLDISHSCAPQALCFKTI